MNAAEMKTRDIQQIEKWNKIFGLFFIIIGILTFVIFSAGFWWVEINITFVISIAFGLMGVLFIKNNSQIRKDLRKGLKIRILYIIICFVLFILIQIIPLIYYIYHTIVDEGMWILGIFMYLSFAIPIFLIPNFLFVKLINKSFRFLKHSSN